MKPWVGRGLALGLGLGFSVGALALGERHLRAEELASVARVTDPPCVQYGVREGASNRGRGWHDDAEPAGLSEGVTRVVVVGDSVSYGVGVQANQAWPHLLTETLRAQLGRHSVELFNFATNGYDARQVACLVRHRIAAWQPDLVLYGAYSNDLAPTYVLHSIELGAPLFTAPQVPDPVRLLPRPLSDLAIRHSAAWRRLQGSRYIRMAADKVDGETGPGLSEVLAQLESDLMPRAAADLRDWSEDSGVPVLALALPPHVLADPTGCTTRPGDTWSCERLAQRHALLVEHLDNSGLPTTDILPTLQASGLVEAFLTPERVDVDHPNASGQQVFARGAYEAVIAHLGHPVLPADELGGSGGRRPKHSPKKRAPKNPQP